MFCAQNYIVPYANVTSNPCTGDTSERTLRKMHAALLACARWVYPDESIESTYHKVHVVLSLRGKQGAPSPCPDWLRRSISPRTIGDNSERPWRALVL